MNMTALRALLEITMYSALLYGALMGFRHLTRGRVSPALRHALWLLLAARLLLPVTLASPVSLFTLPERPAAAQATAAPSAQPAHSLSALTQMPVARQTAPVADRMSVTASLSPAAPPSASPWNWLRRDWPDVLLYLWLAGVAAMAANLLRLTIRRNRRLWRNCFTPPKELQRQMKSLAQSMGIRSIPRLLLSPNIASPCLTAGLCPVLLLPADMAENLSPEQTAFALEHELIHFRRGDHLVEMLWNVLRCVHWFNPVVWLAIRAVREDMELACDRTLVRSMDADRRRRYAQTLLVLFSHSTRAELALGMAQGSARRAAEQRIRGVFAPDSSRRGMKALSGLLAILLLVGCFTTACQPTPNKPAVVQKNIDKMEQQAIGSSGAMSTPARTADVTSTTGEGAAKLKARLQVPDQLTEDLTDGSGRLTVSIDANLIVPDADKLPTAKVGMGTFTQGQVDKMLELLLKGRPLYDAKTASQRTKKEIWPILQDFYDMRDGKKKVTVDGSLDENIAIWEKAYKDAPDEVQKIPTDTKLHPFDAASYNKHSTITIMPYDYLDGVSEMSGNPAYVLIKNQTQLNQIWAMFVTNTNDGAPSYMPLSMRLLQEQIDIEREYAKPAITAEQAQQTADELVQNLGITDMACVVVELANNNHSHRLAYDVRYTRMLNSVPVTLVNETGGGPQVQGTDENPGWAYETLTVVVDENGVVEFQWLSPYTQPQVVTNDTQILAFPDVKTRMEKMILAKYANVDKGTKMELSVDTVQLGLMRVTDPRKLNAGMLVPVWDFLGTQVFTDKSGHRHEDEQRRENLLTINAIDGTVINRDLGY